MLLAALALSFTAVSQAQQPANDRFSRAQRISGPTGTVPGSNLNATQQAGEPVHAVAGTGHSIWYRWAPAYPARVTFSTAGSSFDTVIAVYTGGAVNALTWVAANDNASALQATSSCSFIAAAGSDYAIAIDGANDEQGSVVLQWTTMPLNDDFEDFQALNGVSGNITSSSLGATVQPSEPLATDPSVGSTVWFSWPSVLAGSVTFSTAGSSFDTILAVYSGTDIDGLTLVAANDNNGEQPTSEVTWDADPGARYRIVLAGRDGASGDYSLSWSQVLPPPDNDAFSAATPLVGFTGQVNGLNGGATLEPGEPSHAPNATGGSVWYSWTAPRDGKAHFDTSSSLFPTVLAVYTGEAVDSLSVVARSADGPPAPAAQVDFNTTGGLQYWVALDGQSGALGLFLLRWTYADLNTPNNMFTNAQAITGFMGAAPGENFYADTEAGEPYHAGDPGGRSIWYRWVSPGNFRVSFKTQGSNFDTLLAVYTGDNLIDGLTEITSNDDDPNAGLTSAVAFNAVAGTRYSIAVDGSTDRGINNAPIGMAVLSWQPASPDFIGLLPAQGMVGSIIKVCGLDLLDAQSVSFGDVPSAFFFQSGYLVATVPAGATTGPLTVVDGLGNTRMSSDDFTLLPGLPPQLQLQRPSPTTLRLSWPAQFTGYRLESSMDLSPDGWRVEEDPKHLGAEWVVLEEFHPEAFARYYRLSLP